ncbi:MAG: molybdopterin-binding domain of aldehyde dehydrogenase family protein [Rhodospirillales bacterium]|nr:molybdopterin-binding domain of aldehyde dehydrogenase family protein [Rhodospirillales bacterium]
MAGLLPNPTRRAVLKGAATASLGLVVGFSWGGLSREAKSTAEARPFLANAFVRIAPDDTVTVISKHTEMGQGVYTGVATILADELDADWSRVRIETAPVDLKLYINSALRMQGTGGSLSMTASWDQLRKAGATARAMLVAAAAADWGVPANEVTVAAGVVHHARSGKTARFGALAAIAAALPVPTDVALKDPKDFALIGQPHLARLDSTDKTDGTAKFTIDVTLPGMLTALVAHAPRFGATVKSFDDSAAKAVPGVVGVVQLPTGVAVVARGFWAAKKGRDALKVTWDDGKAETRGSPEMMAAYRAAAAQPGLSAKRIGDSDSAIARAAKHLSANFEFPYLAHAPMEPLDCVVRLTKTDCEIWSGTQMQSGDQKHVAALTGLDPEYVRINTLYAGGGFGRRGPFDSDYTMEAASIARAMGADGTPIKLIWTREDDIRGGKYRPMYYHAVEAGLDADGGLIAWRHRVVGQSIMKGTPFDSGTAIDGSSIDGLTDLPYAIPNLTVELHTTESAITVNPMRSVGLTHTTFAIETFIDELAHAAGKDPYAFRRALLAKQPTWLAVLDLAAEKAEWSRKAPKGSGRGIAISKFISTIVAQVADVTVGADGKITVDRVVCAVDCGIAINPDIVRAQMEGGVGFGLGAAMHGAITLKNGMVEQSNFHDYHVLRLVGMPKVEVHILPSSEPPKGVGEPGVPPIGPAVANAVFAATGKRIRTLPLMSSTSA